MLLLQEQQINNVKSAIGSIFIETDPEKIELMDKEGWSVVKVL